MDERKFSKLMYALTKEAARHGFTDFLEEYGLTEQDYYEVISWLKSTYCIETYI